MAETPVVLVTSHSLKATETSQSSLELSNLKTVLIFLTKAWFSNGIPVSVKRLNKSLSNYSSPTSQTLEEMWLT